MRYEKENMLFIYKKGLYVNLDHSLRHNMCEMVNEMENKENFEYKQSYQIFARTIW